MNRVNLIKKGSIKMEFFDTGEGNQFHIDDTVGRNYGLPFTFGVAEVYPSKGIEFEYFRQSDESIAVSNAEE